VRNIYNLGLSFTLSTLMLIGFYSIVLSWRRLRRKSVSQEVRSLFLRKHVSYVVVLILLQQF